MLSPLKKEVVPPKIKEVAVEDSNNDESYDSDF